MAPLTIFAKPFASKPNVINATGPIAPIATVNTTIAFFTPEDRLLNFSTMPPTNSKIGVTACKNVCPTGTSASFKSSTDLRNLFIAESAVTPSSVSDNNARSSIDVPANSRTRAA